MAVVLGVGNRAGPSSGRGALSVAVKAIAEFMMAH
jgi:hypothetical protein